MYFIRTFGFMGLMFPRSYSTANLDTDAIHLRMRTFIWYWGIYNWCELIVKLSVKDVGFRIIVQETICSQSKN